MPEAVRRFMARAAFGRFSGVMITAWSRLMLCAALMLGLGACSGGNSPPWGYNTPPNAFDMDEPAELTEPPENPAVVIGDFRNPPKAPLPWPDLGAGVSRSLAHAMLNDGEFEVIYNRRLAADVHSVLDHPSHEWASRFGKLAEKNPYVRLVVIGTVTDFHHTNELPKEVGRRGLFGQCGARRDRAVLRELARAADAQPPRERGARRPRPATTAPDDRCRRRGSDTMSGPGWIDPASWLLLTAIVYSLGLGLVIGLPYRLLERAPARRAGSAATRYAIGCLSLSALLWGSLLATWWTVPSASPARFARIETSAVSPVAAHPAALPRETLQVATPPVSVEAPAAAPSRPRLRVELPALAPVLPARWPACGWESPPSCSCGSCGAPWRSAG